MLKPSQVAFLESYISIYQDSLTNNLKSQSEFLRIANVNKKLNHPANHAKSNSFSDVFYFNKLADWYLQAAESDAAIISILQKLVLNSSFYTFTTVQLYDYIDKVEKDNPPPLLSTRDSILHAIHVYVYHTEEPLYNPQYPDKLIPVPGKLHIYKPYHNKQIKLNF